MQPDPRLRSPVLSSLLALLVAWSCLAPRAGAQLQALQVQWEIKNTVATEGKNLTLKMKVSNSDIQALTSVVPINLVAEGSGNATWWKWPKPTFTELESGESKTFKITFRPQLPGFVTFSGQAQAYDAAGNLQLSDVVQTPEFFVQPKKFKNTAVTGSFGFAALKGSKKQKIILRFVNEDSGSPIAGLTVSMARVKKEDARVIVLVTDSLERYPTQLLRVQGTSTAPPPGEGELPQYDDVPLSSSTGATGGSLRPGPIRTVETSLLGQVRAVGSFTPSIDTREADAVIKAIKQASSSKLPLPPGLTGKLKTIKPKVTVAASDGLQTLRDLLAGGAEGDVTRESFVATGLEQFPYDGGGAPAPITCTDLDDPLIQGAADWAYPGDDFLDVQFTRLEWGDSAFVICGTKVAKGFDKESAPANPPTSIPVSVTASDAAEGDIPPVVLSGDFEAVSTSTLALGAANTLDEAGQTTAFLPAGQYSTAVHRPGFDAGSAPLDLQEEGASLDIPQVARLICSGVVVEQNDKLTTLLSPGATLDATAIFLDCEGNIVPCDGPVLWQVESPAKNVIATVDANGVATITKNCGAGYLTAWCDGIQAAGLQFDTNCNGKLPPLPPPPKKLKDDDLRGSWRGTYTLSYIINNPLCGNVPQAFMQAGQMSMNLQVTDSPLGDYSNVFGSWSMSGIRTLGFAPQCISQTLMQVNGSIQGGRLENSDFTGTLVLPDTTASFTATGDADELNGTWTSPLGATGSFSLTPGFFQR